METITVFNDKKRTLDFINTLCWSHLCDIVCSVNVCTHVEPNTSLHVKGEGGWGYFISFINKTIFPVLSCLYATLSWPAAGSSFISPCQTSDTHLKTYTSWTIDQQQLEFHKLNLFIFYRNIMNPHILQRFAQFWVTFQTAFSLRQPFCHTLRHSTIANTYLVSSKELETSTIQSSSWHSRHLPSKYDPFVD